MRHVTHNHVTHERPESERGGVGREPACAPLPYADPVCRFKWRERESERGRSSERESERVRERKSAREQERERKSECVCA